MKKILLVPMFLSSLFFTGCGFFTSDESAPVAAAPQCADYSCPEGQKMVEPSCKCEAIPTAEELRLAETTCSTPKGLSTESVDTSHNCLDGQYYFADWDMCLNK